MAGAFGKTPAAATPTQLNSINVDQSRYGDPIPLVYGVNRIPITLLWYGAFNSQAQYNSGGKGGKGPPSSYAYSASCVMGLCEGPITKIGQLWKDKDITTLAAENLTLFLGSSTQAPWPYLVESFPLAAVPYNLTAYLAEAGLSLGGSAAMPNYTAEVYAFLSLPGKPFQFVSGLAANSYQADVHMPSPIPDGQWDVTFSDNESRTCTFLTTSGVQLCSWDSTLGLVNAVTSSAIAGGLDAEPSAIMVDYCTDLNHGANFQNLNVSQIQNHTWSSGGVTYYDNFKTYVEANGIYISPYEDTVRAAADFVKDILEIGNSNCVTSAGSFKVVPYGDVPVTGNGVTYTPNLQPLFAFDDDDFLPNTQGENNNADPVLMVRKPLTDTYNVVRVEFLDRGNAYNTALAEWTDPLDIAVNGIRVMQNKTFHQICDARVAGQVAALIGQRQLYVRNTYQFSVRLDYSLLEPMDLVAITDTALGIVDRLVRITEIEDDENDVFTITAEDCLVGTASAPKYNFQLAQGYAANFAAVPFMAGAPVVFSVPAALVGPGGGCELAFAVGPGTVTYAGSTSGEYGGCDAYGSLDGVTYRYLGRINGSARLGTIAPGGAITSTATSVKLLLSAGCQELGLQLDSASAADFAANRALIYLDGEIVGFETVALVGPGTYSVTISRGLFGTQAVSHAAGASWARLDQTILYMPFDPGMVGQTLDMQFTSYNSVGRNEQPQSEATVFTHVIEVQNAGQLVAGPLTLNGTGVGISGTSVFKSKTTTAWDSGAWSLQAYTNGCFVQFQPNQTNGYLMVGLHHAPGLSGDLDNTMDFSLYCVDNATLAVYENWTGTTVAYTGLGSYAAGDDLSVTYDGAIVRYIHNGNVIRQVSVPGYLTLYLSSIFYNPQVAVSSLRFGADGISTPVLFNARGNCVVADSLAGKQGGVSAWDSDIYSINGYPTCNVVFKANQTNANLMVGFLEQPTAIVGSFGALLCAFYCEASGIWSIYESGSPVSGVTGTYTTATRFSMTYDGSTVSYFVDGGTAVRTKALSGATLYTEATFNSPNGYINSLDFGPGSIVPIIDTSAINLDAVSSITSLNTGTIGTGFITSGNTSVSATPATLTIETTGSPIAIDCYGLYNANFGGPSTTTGSMEVQILRDGSALASGGVYTTGTLTGYAPPSGEGNIPVTLVATDDCPGGTHTYTVVFTVNGIFTSNPMYTPGFGNASSGYLKLREIKR